jgi:chromosome segregation ATPase
MNKEDTPRTDKIHSEKDKEFRDNLTQYRFMHDHAETLEKELTAARDGWKLSTEQTERAWEELTAARAEVADMDSKNLVLRQCIQASSNEQTRLKAELATVTEQRDEAEADYKCLAELLDGHDATECRMNLVRLKEQRDRLVDQLDDAVAEATNAVNDIIRMKWQRDRLAEAIRLTLMENLDLCDGDVCTLKRLKDAIGFEAEELYEALQSLNQPQKYDANEQ